ncbi:MAG: RNA 3'-terminal phosphate cyclase, partial [Desulfobacterales bacterium]
MISIDGSFGEGGGQILRTSLALSLLTGKAFEIRNIRSGRKKPGLMHQHLTALKAAQKIGNADVRGGQLGSGTVIFVPGRVQPGYWHFSVGTAGSCTLVLQTVLPVLLTAGGESELLLEGGTHNPFAPPFDFLARTFLPLLNRMGPEVTATLFRPGFYPAGGGKFRVSVRPCQKLTHLHLTERGEILSRSARAIVAKLPLHIARRELGVIEKKLSWP